MEQRQSPSGARVGLVTRFAYGLTDFPKTINSGDTETIARFEDVIGEGSTFGPLNVVLIVNPIFKIAAAGQVGAVSMQAIDVQSGLTINSAGLGVLWAPADDEFSGQSVSGAMDLPAGHIYRIDVVLAAAATVEVKRASGRIWGYR